ncbi:MAG: BatD family protein [Candidatus Omnitrophota bacterium]
MIKKLIFKKRWIIREYLKIGKAQIITDRETQMSADSIKRKIVFVAIMFLGLSFFNLCQAQDIAFEATVNNSKVSLGQSIKLSFAFHNTQDIPFPKLPETEWFQWQYSGPSTMMSIVGGKVNKSITHNYTLLVLKKGIFTLGPFSVDYKGKTYSSKPITIEVIAGPAVPGYQPPASAGAEAGLEDRIFMTMEVEKTKVYLNELVPVTIKLYINGLSIRDVQFPQFDYEGFSAEKIEQPRQRREILSGIPYDVVQFETNIFGIRPGEFILGPAEIKCNCVIRKQQGRQSSSFEDFFGQDIFKDFFGRYESHPLSLKSAPVSITVMALPQNSRPESFNGAVGNFEFKASAGPKQVQAGDPITLKMVISGKGNFDTVAAPEINNKEGFKVYEPQTKTENGVKVFEQILIPQDDKISQTPTVSFSFFNPEKGEYQTITRGPFMINVFALGKEEELTIVEYANMPEKTLKQEQLGEGIIYIKESAGKLRRIGDYLYKNEVFLWFQALPLILFLSFLISYKKYEKIRTDVQYARRLRAPKKAKAGIKTTQQFLSQEKPAEFYNSIFKTLQDYLGGKFHLSAAGITIEVVDEVLKSKGIEKNTLFKIEELFKDCDAARYAPSEFNKSKMESSLKRLEEIIDYLQRQKTIL